MATRKPKESDAGLPFAALQLLAPPVRLVSAALWKVLKQRDVMQYGVVEEFVTSACEAVPGLLTVRHQGKLALGLRGRLILELCSKRPDEKGIMLHMERIRPPAGMSSSSAPPTAKKDVKILRTVESFHSLVHTLLTDPRKRELFFKEEFPVDYGPTFDRELEKLLWEFLIRLDQLLPVPNLAQTVSWLSEAPPVLEECARAATQPQLLNILLQHQTCLGHLEAAASLPPNMGDSILDSLSLLPSGREPSKSAVDNSGGTQTRDKTPFITPVIGLISNEDVPFMISANKRKLGAADELAGSANKCGGQTEEEGNTPRRSSRMKRKLPDRTDSESDEDEEEDEEDEEVLAMIRSRKKRISRSLRNRASRLRQGGDQSANERDRAVLETYLTQLGVKTLDLPENPTLRSALVSSLSSHPRVVIEKLSLVASAGADRTDRGGKSFYTEQKNKRRKSPAKTPTRKSRPEEPDSDYPGLDDKENHPVLPVSSSSSLQRSNTETSALPGDGEDYVADSEDEATKNFKGRLFMKRYYKTKHGTYVPTLREYWKPGMAWRDLPSAGGKRR